MLGFPFCSQSFVLPGKKRLKEKESERGGGRPENDPVRRFWRLFYRASGDKRQKPNGD